MAVHNLLHELNTAFEKSASGAILKTSTGYLLGWGTTVGNGIQGWSPAALFLDTNAAADSQVFINEGTNTSATWTTVGDTT